MKAYNVPGVKKPSMSFQVTDINEFFIIYLLIIYETPKFTHTLGCHLQALPWHDILAMRDHCQIKSRRMRRAECVARMGEVRVVYRILEGKHERKKPPGRPRRRWEDNIKMNLQKCNVWGMDWFDLAGNKDRWRALVNALMDLRVP